MVELSWDVCLSSTLYESRRWRDLEQILQNRNTCYSICVEVLNKCMWTGEYRFATRTAVAFHWHGALDHASGQHIDSDCGGFSKSETTQLWLHFYYPSTALSLYISQWYHEQHPNSHATTLSFLDHLLVNSSTLPSPKDGDILLGPDVKFPCSNNINTVTDSPPSFPYNYPSSFRECITNLSIQTASLKVRTVGPSTPSQFRYQPYAQIRASPLEICAASHTLGQSSPSAMTISEVQRVSSQLSIELFD